MRHPSLIPLSHDHHHGLALALRCRKQALGQIKPMGPAGLRERAEEFRSFFERNLVLHFRAEEEILFPRLLAQLPESQPIVDQLCREHEAIRKAMPQLAGEPGLGKVIFDLGDLLERHIRKEERELFPLIESQLDPKQAEEMGEAIRKILGAETTDRK
jgi:hemerythrin-like domain-containing protein